MKKGISPVVAVVLLIAIAVIAAVGVWYWVGSYTGQPNVTTSVKSFTVTSCNGTSVFVQNNGKDKLKDSVEFTKTDGTPEGYIDFAGTPVDAGNAAWVKLQNTTKGDITTKITGNFEVMAANTMVVPFSC